MIRINPKSSYELLQQAKIKIKNLGSNPTAQDYKEIKELARAARIAAEKELEQSYKTNSFKNRIENALENIFEKFAKFFKHNPNENKDQDLSKTIINAVLIGNILKDLATGIISTSQSFTNPDLPKDKRLFVGSYDIVACITTVIISYLFGPMAVNKIISGYERALKPIKGLPKQSIIIAGLTTFTSIVLQSIVAKRMIAPAISTPMAGVLAKKLDKDNKNKSK